MCDLHRDLMVGQARKVEDMFGEFLGPHRLNIGCAGNKLEDWVNLDKDGRTGPDVVCNLAVDRIPLRDKSFDVILASHILEHIPKANLFWVFRELHRVLKPGGHLICITPYGSSDDAWDNPHHRQLFTENTYAYFSKRLYEHEDSAGYKAYEGEEYCDWQIARMSLVPYPEYMDDPEIEWKKKHLRNVIRELHVVMKAVKQ